MSTDQYWAALPPNDLTMKLTRKVSDYYDFCMRFGFLSRWQRSYLAYYGYSESGTDSSRLNQAGSNGELYVLKVNHFRSLLSNLLTLTTSQRPALQPKAQNTDSKSMNQTVLARSIIDYYMTEKQLERELKKATEFGLIAGEGFVTEEWNATMGNIYTVTPEGVPIYDGDIQFRVFHPVDVIRECWSENSRSNWYIIRDFKNKYDLAAKYPELADDILSVAKSPDYVSRYTFLSFDAITDSDYIPVYRFFHEPSEALPNGRQLEFVDVDIFLNDGPLAYKNMPIYRLAPADFHGTPFGFTVAYDLMGLQKNYDSLASIVTTNQMNYGVQNILIPRGADINVVSLAQGLNAIEYDNINGRPEPLNLVQTPIEIFNQMDRIQQMMEILSGVNAVARGNPDSSLHSGSALALVAAQAVQFNSGLQQSYNRLLEDVGTGLIEILQEYATTPRVAAIAGRSNRYRIQDFKGSDLNGINRVCVEMVNPISKCLSKDTPVLMFDGTVKMVQDVEVDDKLMGPDSKPRTVSSIASGTEMMYRVKSSYGAVGVDYGCNESHILTLRYKHDHPKAGFWVDLSIREYIDLPDAERKALKGFTAGVTFRDPKVLPVSCYLLGAWIGEKGRLKAVKSVDPDREDVVALLTESGGKIPHTYLTTTREGRAQLLAGLIDSDGGGGRDQYWFEQRDKGLADQVVFLARSLGYRTTFHEEADLPGNPPVYTVRISGNLAEVPVRDQFKRVGCCEFAPDTTDYAITVTQTGIGTYYGFTLEEEPHFMLGDFTVTHNTAAGRLQEAQDLLQNKLINNPAHYFEVITTGTIDSLYEHETSQILNIRSENEDLMNGLPVKAVFTDQHVEHIKEHATCLDSPEARANPQVVQSVTAHIQEHVTLLKTTDPQLLGLLGQQSLPPSPPPGAPGAAPGTPPGAPAGPPSAPPHAAGVPPGMAPGPGVPGVQNATPPVLQEAAEAQPAGMPKLPNATPPALAEAYQQVKSNVV